MKTKILFFLATLNAGGAERVSVTMMRQLNRDKFDIYLVLVSKEGEFMENIPSYINIIELNSHRTLFSIFSLCKVIERIDADIIYSTLFRTHIALYLALKRSRSRAKLFLRSPSSPKILIQRGELGWLMRFLIKRAYLSADKILAQTPEMRDEIISYHHISGDKIEVFMNPIDKELIDSKIKSSSNPFVSFPQSSIHIIGAGRLSLVKGFDTLVYALKEVLKSNDNFYLHLIGRDAGEKKRLEEIISKLGIVNRVKFWGFQDNPYKFFYHSQLYVLSSRREGLPNTVLENLYLQKPIVATRCIPFMSSLISDKHNGYLVEVDDITALAEAILDYKKIKTDTPIEKESINITVTELFSL